MESSTLQLAAQLDVSAEERLGDAERTFGLSKCAPAGQAPDMQQMHPFSMMQEVQPGLVSAHSGRFQGRVKSYNGSKGWGFIECAETYLLYQCDVFLTKMHAFELGVGGSVEFSVILKGPQGEPHAVDTLPLGPQTRRSLGAGRGSKGKGKNRGFRKKRGDRNNTKRAEQENITV